MVHHSRSSVPTQRSEGKFTDFYTLYGYCFFNRCTLSVTRKYYVTLMVHHGETTIIPIQRSVCMEYCFWYCKFGNLCEFYFRESSRMRSFVKIKVSKREKIRNRYHQVPHLTQDTTWESNKLAIRHHKQEPRGQPFPSRWPQGINKQTHTKA